MDGSALSVEVSGKRRVICCHKAVLSGNHHPNSLAAVAECVAAGVPRLEVDLQFLADDTMLVFHDRRLDGETTGTGTTRALDRDSARRLRYRDGSPLAFFADVVDLIRGSRTVLQVDLKLMRPITTARTAMLGEVLASVREQTLVGSQAHWNVRPLISAGFRVALDPTLHWHYRPGRRGNGLVPAREGFHGLWDDAAIAHMPGVDGPEYVRVRIDDLAALLPAVEWMVDAQTCLRLAEIGAPLGELLGDRGIELAAWTLRDTGVAEMTALLERLFQIGATTVIAESAPKIAAYAAALG